MCRLQVDQVLTTSTKAKDEEFCYDTQGYKASSTRRDLGKFSLCVCDCRGWRQGPAHAPCRRRNWNLVSSMLVLYGERDL